MILNNKASILCVHQGNELYGSDRVFLESIIAFRQAMPNARIDVVLPAPGPLTGVLSGYPDHIFYGPLWVPRKSELKTRGGVLRIAKLPFSVFRAMRLMRHYDLTYINTIVVANFILAAVFRRFSAILHVHELIPGVAGKLLGLSARLAADAVVCNSHATAMSFGLSGWPAGCVIWNGTEIPHLADTPKRIDNNGPLRVLMPGRINSWKGQELLIDAVAQLNLGTRCQLSVRIVGDVYLGQDHFRENILKKIKCHNLQTTVKLIGFCEQMAEMYRWADVVVVPSMRPEPFGVVAIEAMSYARPVIAAAHGGLLEIVEDGVTGWLFSPRNIADLSNTLKVMLFERDKIEQMGQKAKLRATTIFSNNIYRKKIGGLAVEILRKQLVEN